jgi:hypothetical protein
MFSIADRSRIARPARPVGSGVPLERYYPLGARRIPPAAGQHPARAGLPMTALAGRPAMPGVGVAGRPLPASPVSGRRFLPAF